MPIPEPSRYSPSNLTKEQRQSQLAAVYGVDMQELSHAELARMRQIVEQHDAQRQPIRTIDLNNPPKEAYTHQKFPKMVYDLENSTPGHIVSAVVRDEEELAKAIAAGYSKEAPAFGNSPDDTLSPKYLAEANHVQQQIEETRKRGPGRPKVA